MGLVQTTSAPYTSSNRFRSALTFDGTQSLTG